MKKLLIVISMFFVGCTTTQYEVKKLENQKFEIKGGTSDGKIGLNEKNQVVIKKERSADFELRVQELANTHLQDRATRNMHMLKMCRADLADPRLGGNGEVSPISAVDDLHSLPEIREEMGLDKDGNLNIVTEEFFEERLRAERKYGKALEGIIKVTEKHTLSCENDLRKARLKSGLPAEKGGSDLDREFATLHSNK